MSDNMRAGFAIIMASFHGREFDFNTMTFKDDG